jgi:cell division protein FtsB
MEKAKTAMCVLAILAVLFAGLFVYQTISINNLHTEISERDVDIASKNQSLQEMNTTISLLKERIDDFENKCMSLESLLCAKISENSELKGNLTILENLRQAITTLENTKKELESQIETLKSSISEKDAKIANLDNQVNMLLANISTRDAEIFRLQVATEVLTNQLNNSATQVLSLEKDLQNQQTINHQLEDRMTNAIAQINELTIQINQLTTQINELKTPDVRANLVSEFFGKFWPWDVDIHKVRGAIYNCGTEKAKNVIISLYWKQSGKVYHSEIFKVDEIDGKSCILIEMSYSFNDKEEEFYYTILYGQ